LPLFVVKCGVHGLFLDYQHGYDEHFNCPECREELQ
jgi:transcription initiation factor IIE alpha subunit